MSTTAQKKTINWWRVFFTGAYFMVAVGIIYFGRNIMFYLDSQVTSYHFGRFLWCISASFFGFSVLVAQLWEHQKSPFPKYVTYYPALLVAQSALVFSVMHLFSATSGFVFYYASFSICFILAFLADNFWGFIFSLITKGSK